MKLVLLVGPPGSGKSTLANTYNDFVYINQDTQGKEHLRLFNDALFNLKNIIVDRMNFNVAQRSRYLGEAKLLGYDTEIIVLHEPRKVCLERMRLREDHPTIKDERSANQALNTFFSKYERPLPNEADKISFRYPEGRKDEAVVIDLDGTLCNIDHRLSHVRGTKKDWKAFFADIVNDTPNAWCASIYDQFSERHPVVFASGRPDDHERVTREWLTKNCFSTDHLYMRCRGDHRQDYIAKEIILDFEILTRFKPLFFVDDRKQVVDMWRSRGFTCLHCAEGGF